MQLPKSFIEKYQTILGPEAQAFFDSFDQPAQAGFRTNPLKETQKNFPDPIAQSDWGHYGKISGKSIAHTTGLVYSQEPAAQVVGQVASPEPGMKVLDLAAAPGGKSTHLLSYLNNTGILVSNEISKKRSKILAENIERFGARNVVVTNESPERLAKVFPAYFDVIVLDAPCSGEGMFRKDPDSIQYWHSDYPNECASLQKDILEQALKMLAPKGRLVYSTCTWAPEENEEIVSWLLDQYPDLSLLPVPLTNGMVAGIDRPQVARMYPHHFKGEGQFVAHLQNQAEKAPAKRIKPPKMALTSEQKKLWQSFCQHHLKIDLNGPLQTFGDELYLLPEGLPDLSKLKIARNGLHLGTFKKKRFEPSFALGLALKPSEVKQSLTINSDQYQTYVSGNTVQLEGAYDNGWYQVVVDGNGLGFAKVVGQTLKNFYPKGLRFHIT